MKTDFRQRFAPVDSQPTPRSTCQKMTLFCSNQIERTKLNAIFLPSASLNCGSLYKFQILHWHGNGRCLADEIQSEQNFPWPLAVFYPSLDAFQRAAPNQDLSSRPNIGHQANGFHGFHCEQNIFQLRLELRLVGWIQQIGHISALQYAPPIPGRHPNKQVSWKQRFVKSNFFAAVLPHGGISGQATIQALLLAPRLEFLFAARLGVRGEPPLLGLVGWAHESNLSPFGRYACLE